MIGNQKGSAIITSALFMAVLAGVVYFYSNVQMLNVTKQYRKTKSMAYAHQIAAGLAQSLRRSYDVAKLIQDNPTNVAVQGLCVGPGLNVETVGTVRLCLKNRSICMLHPANREKQICASINDNTLFAKSSSPIPSATSFHSFAQWLLAPSSAFAQPYRPNPPPSLETNNDLSAPPICLKGDCRVICNGLPGANADCVSFTFCPIMGQVGSCDPDELVTQTVGFLRDN